MSKYRITLLSPSKKTKQFIFRSSVHSVQNSPGYIRGVSRLPFRLTLLFLTLLSWIADMTWRLSGIQWAVSPRNWWHSHGPWHQASHRTRKGGSPKESGWRDSFWWFLSLKRNIPTKFTARKTEAILHYYFFQTHKSSRQTICADRMLYAKCHGHNWILMYVMVYSTTYSIIQIMYRHIIGWTVDNKMEGCGKWR